jgi:ubiquinone/menaquinone biosynthesis C-methylase UbiE
MKCLGLGIILLAIIDESCAPYQFGPFMKGKEIHEVFSPILKFMDYKPGMVFADIGASSGALTVMMATLMDSSLIYIQDIDTSKLKKTNVDKIIAYYSRQSRIELKTRNKFQIIIGSKERSNLADQSIDLIYSNATFHEFDSPDSMLIDLRRKLKPNGRIFIRDGFKNAQGVVNGVDKSCGKILKTVDEFVALMKKRGFSLVKESPNMDGYPLFGFKIEEQGYAISNHQK